MTETLIYVRDAVGALQVKANQTRDPAKMYASIFAGGKAALEEYSAERQAAREAEIAAATPTLSDIRKAAIEQIDAAAEAARLRFITGGAGQAMTYQTKLEQARKLQAGEPGPFPMLLASVGVEGETVQDVAALVIATYDAWEPIGAQIENLRLTAKRDINEASADAIPGIVAGIAWPSPG